MADTKVSALTAATPLGTDVIYLVDDPGGTPVSKKATVSDLLDVGVADITASSAATVPLDPDADTVLVVQSGNLVQAGVDDVRPTPADVVAPSASAVRLFEFWERFGVVVTSDGTHVAGSLATSRLSGTGSQVFPDSAANFVPSLRLDTGTTTTGRCGISFSVWPILWNAAASYRVAGRVKLSTLSTAGDQYDVRFGLADSWAATPTHGGLYFQARHGQTNWEAVTMDDSVATVTDTGVAQTGSTWYVLDMYYNGTTASFRINGTEVAAQSSNLPDFLTTLYLGQGIYKAAGTANRTSSSDWWYCELPASPGVEHLQI